ncbi:MAG: redoxin domain-containing protein [Flavobacteriaceae bacterium]|nr:redoxin domain-containing protein [Flavobacteriaceae bacterium]
MKKIHLIPLFLLLLLYNCKKEKKSNTKTTVLIGTVIDRKASKHLSLIEKTGDYRVNAKKIPIKNGKFIYTIKSNFIQEYQMAFNDELEKGYWMAVRFFNDKDTINFTLYQPEKYNDNIILGGTLNKRRKEYISEQTSLFYSKINTINLTKVDSLSKINQWNSKQVSELYNILSKEKDFNKRNDLYKKINDLRVKKEDLTPQARFWQDKIDSIIKDYQNWNDNFIITDNTLLGFSLLVDQLYSNTYEKNFNFLTLEKKLKNYQSKFKKHPYNQLSKNLLNGIKNAKKGGYYSDFESRTADNKQIKASSIVTKNKLTLIDLWAPWCGPCIAKSKKLKPEYLKLHKKGLEVFAVIGGINKKEKYTEAKNKYQYPWKINYEINNEFNIWDKYNISRSGGSQFLVNKKGKILAVNPEPKVIDSILNTIQKP